MIIGIDLGTTNTCASHVVGGRPKVIPGRTGTATIPSMITFDPDGSFHVGQRAADRQILQPTRTVYGTKRLLGRTYRPELAAELQGHFAYPLAEAEGQRFGVRIDDRVISMDTIAARVLDEVRSSAEAHLGEPVEAAVITVPAYFTEVQREAVRRAAAQAKLTVYRIVNEPTAAAVAYGHKQHGRARIAVWDFGGGTFDFSIVDVDDGQLEVVATGGENFLGGSDFDDALASHLLDEHQRTSGVTVDPTPQQIARLREAAEKAKITLSAETEAVVELLEITRSPRRDLRIEVTRARFEFLVRPLVDRAVAIASDVMSAAGISPADVNDVVLVGGTTRVPLVQQAVANLFQRRPSKRINPDEAVALGAALLADEIGSGGAPTLLDILPMSVGRAVAGRRFEPIVPRRTRLPAVRDLTLPADLLGGVSLPLFQGESPDASRNEYLCTVIVEDRALWDGGRATVRLSFDEHAVMAIEARDARTGKPLPVRLDRSRPLADVLAELGLLPGRSPRRGGRRRRRWGRCWGSCSSCSSGADLIEVERGGAPRHFTLRPGPCRAPSYAASRTGPRRLPVVTTGCRRRRRQHSGQLEPFRVRLLMVALQTCPKAQRHQIRLSVPATTSRGVSLPFLVGCHSAAILGNTAASEFDAQRRRFTQNGQPEPSSRLAILADHSWSGPSGHFHQARRAVPASTSRGRELAVPGRVLTSRRPRGRRRRGSSSRRRACWRRRGSPASTGCRRRTSTRARGPPGTSTRRSSPSPTSRRGG